MLDGTEDSLVAATNRWLADFERALGGSDPHALETLFHSDGHWRDLLALTWHVQTFSGAATIAAALTTHAGDAKPSGFETDRKRTPPRRVNRAGTQVIEAIILFDTAAGKANGVLRLIGDGDTLQAWTLLTALDEITGFEETVDAARPTGEVYSRDFSGPNWQDKRDAATAYDDRDPAVLVVGGGQAGLSIAARLTQLGVDTLIVDREARVGDNWRNRYHALTLHNQVQVNHLPYLPYPPNWPTYIPKDKIAGWFEAYAEIMELNFWTGTELAGGAYDEQRGRWSVELSQANGETRKIHPRHIVMATGVSGIPNLPEIPSLADFTGAVVPSGAYGSAEEWTGRNAIVIGTGNSGHDIAQDLHSHGAHVTLVQRSSTLIVSVEPSAQLPYALYDEGPNLADCDLIAASMPLRLARKTHQMVTAKSKELDKELLERLARVGFKLDFGKDDTGWQFKYLERGGGYYFNVGCSDLVANGEIGLVQFADIDRFTADGARMLNGETRPADLIVLATGFKGQDHLVRKLFGDAIADRTGPIWGFDEDSQELRNMWMRTGQPGLWFIAGSFAQCRIYSKYLGLQIKACEEGLIPLVR
ncbi:MAG: SidA/IucD/PvdA family monooxygenase [Alphaproteobacteria bacterium]|nr:SidA/IucD/PvdA family monooxygenase [Alphaproteobacteria bacterium]